MTMMYDPPSGWRYGFPKEYNPSNPLEKIRDTLIRDGYPVGEADFAAKHCRFIGSDSELDKLARLHVESAPVRENGDGESAECGCANPEREHANQNEEVIGIDEAREVVGLASNRFPPRSVTRNLTAKEASDRTHARFPNIMASLDDRGPYITTFTGRFYFTDPHPEDVNIHDIAQSLASIRRYTGHGAREYTTAEHSVHIYRWLVAQNATLDERLAGLLHDAPEALSGFGDVSSPRKQEFPAIGEAEDLIWKRAIAPRFDLPADIPAIVHEADKRICADESEQNMHETLGDDPLGVTLEYWPLERARAEFLRAFAEVERARQQQRRVAA